MYNFKIIELIKQLEAFQSIKNPSEGVNNSIGKLKKEISELEIAENQHLYINQAINEIETIVKKYTDLEILYSVSIKDNEPVNSYKYVSDFVTPKNNKPELKTTDKVKNTKREVSKERMTVVNPIEVNHFNDAGKDNLWL